MPTQCDFGVLLLIQPFSVAPGIFSDTFPSAQVDYPFVKRILLTDQRVAAGTNWASLTHKSQFSRSTTTTVTVVTFLKTLAGSKAEVIWHPISHSLTHEFSQGGDLVNWISGPFHDLPTGKCAVEYRLQGVRWGTVDFEVSK